VLAFFGHPTNADQAIMGGQGTIGSKFLAPYKYQRGWQDIAGAGTAPGSTPAATTTSALTDR